MSFLKGLNALNLLKDLDQDGLGVSEDGIHKRTM